MAIEVYTPIVQAGGGGQTTWVTYYDPKIYTESGWQDILFGEIYTGNGPNNGWSYFYVRINVVDPVITEVSKTQTSITVNVSHTNPDSDRVRVYIYRLDSNNNPINGQYFPSQAGTTGVINQNYTQSSLQLGTTYTFRAYAEYLDANGNVMITSGVDQLSVTTNTYNLYTPSTPSLVKAGYDSAGSGYTGKLTATSSSNPRYSQNGSASYIQFELSDGFSNPIQLNSNLTNNDSLQTKSVTFTGLALGTQYVCRARTVYTTIGEVSDWSEFSSATETVDWTPVDVPSGSTWEDMQNTTYFTGFVASASSDKLGAASNASDGDAGTQWESDPYTYENVPSNEFRNISSIKYEFTFTGGVATYDTTSNHNITTAGNTATTSINSIEFPIAGKVFTNNTYIIAEISDVYSVVRGSGTISGTNIANVNGVSRTILQTQILTGGLRQVHFAKPANVAADQYFTGGTLTISTTSTIGGVSVTNLGGSGTVYRVDNNTFNRFEDSNPGTIPTTPASGGVSYQVITEQAVPKSSGLETLNLFARPRNLPSAVRNVKLSSVYYRHGDLNSSDVDIRVNGTLIASGPRSAGSILLSPVSSYNLTPTYSSDNLPGGSGWSLQINVQRGVSGSLYSSTVSEVQLRYTYEVLQ